MIAKTIQQQIESLPMLPTVLAQLMALTPEDDNYFDKVLGLAEKDPALALRIIKISNTANRASVRPVVNLKDAIIRIGVREVVNLITTIAVVEVFVPTSPSEKRLWQHSIQVGFLSRLFATHLRDAHIGPEKMYLCGLLHDLGFFLRFEDSRDKFNKIDEIDWHTPQEHISAEASLFGIDHAEISQNICEIWGVPSPVPLIIGYHHTYELPEALEQRPRFVDALRILQLADICSEISRFYAPLNEQKIMDIVKRVPEIAKWVADHRAVRAAFTDVAETITEADKIYDSLLI